MTTSRDEDDLSQRMQGWSRFESRRAEEDAVVIDEVVDGVDVAARTGDGVDFVDDGEGCCRCGRLGFERQ